MAATGVGFRWLDILEKEFDKACVELDTSLAELESDEPEVVFGARQRIAKISSCFAQLTHKALTVFQHSAKLEAEIVDMRADLIQARAASAGVLQDSGGAAGSVTDAARARAEAAQLAKENAALRETVLALHSELFGARLATKYLDKELAGRIQQLQLLGRDMRTDVRDSLWAQVEAEILLQRHKTLVRVCRGMSPAALIAPRPPPAQDSRDPRAPRTVRVRRDPHQGLGISVTGGREHGVPILISELEADGPAARTGDLFVGDAILAVNDIDLTQACHKEAVHLLQSTKGDCQLCVQFIATDDDDRLSEDNYRFPLYPEEGGVFGGERDGSGATPTAPRTPEFHRPPSEAYSEEECGAQAIDVCAGVASAGAVGTRGYAAILDMDDHSIKIQAELEADVESSPRSVAPPRRHRGPYAAVPSSESAGSTPVHRAQGRRRARDWRTKGDYRPLYADTVSPEPHTLQDSPPLTPSPVTPLLPPREVLRPPTHSLATADASVPNSVPYIPNPTLYVTNCTPNVTSSTPDVSSSVPNVTNSVSNVSTSVPNAPNSVSNISNSLSNITNPLPNVPNSVPNTHNSVPDVPNPINTVVNGDVKANGNGRKRDKAFRIGSARRVTPHSVDRAGPGPLVNGAAPRGKPAPPLLAGEGDPDFGTPV